jgi:hypothetical protein
MRSTVKSFVESEPNTPREGRSVRGKDPNQIKADKNKSKGSKYDALLAPRSGSWLLRVGLPKTVTLYVRYVRNTPFTGHVRLRVHLYWTRAFTSAFVRETRAHVRYGAIR